MENKDIILNNILQIKLILQDIFEEESLCNEGALTEKKYKKVIELLINIEKERLMQLKFWEE